MKKFLFYALAHMITIQPIELPEYKRSESEVPRSLSVFKSYDVEINQSKDKFLLRLNHDDPSLLINYLWNGKSVAQYIAVNEKISLQSLYPDAYNFSIISPLKSRELNINLTGNIKFQDSINVDGAAHIKCKSLKNNDSLRAQQLCFEGQSIVNEGSIKTGRCVVEKCDTIINKKKWSVDENCHLANVEKLFTSKNSFWLVGGCWNGSINQVEFNGDLDVGIAALFSIKAGGVFNGLINVPILSGECGGTFESSSDSKFLVSHHLSLRAKDSIKWEGSVFDKTGNKLPFPKIDSIKLAQLPKKGFYLKSEEGSIAKAGIIDLVDKPVFLMAKKDLHHNQITRAKEGQHGVIVLEGEHINLGEQSQLQGYAAQLNAQESITYAGKAVIESCLQSNDVAQDAIDSAGVFVLNAKKIVTAKESLINAKKAFILAQNTIHQQGAIKVKEDLSETAAAIVMDKTSSVAAKSAFVSGAESVDQKGKLTARQALIMRSKKLSNAGMMVAKNSHFKADRWWLNRGTISIADVSQIDALLAMNVYPGIMDTKKLITNALGDLNLGFYKTQSTDSNTILSFNAGEYLAPIDLQGISEIDKIKAAEQIFLLMAPPNLQAYYRLGKFWLNLGYTFDAAGRFYREWKELPAIYRGASDLMPLLAGSFNFAYSSFQQAMNTKSLVHTIQEFYDEDRQINSNPFDPIRAIQSIVSLSYPVYNFKSVANINFGMIQGFGGNFTNIFDISGCNFWFNNAATFPSLSSSGNSIFLPGGLLFLNNYTLDTSAGFSNGTIGATSISVAAQRSYRAGESSSMSALHTSLDARDLIVNNNLYALAVALKASSRLSLNGNVSVLRKISLMAPEIALKRNSFLTALHGGIFVNGKRIEIGGDINGQHVCVVGKDVVLKAGSNTKSHGSQATIGILADDFISENNSKISVTGNDNLESPENNQIIVSAQKADFQLGSSLEASTGALRVGAGESVKHAATAKGQQVYVKAQNILLKDGSNTEAEAGDLLATLPVVSCSDGSWVKVNTTMPLPGIAFKEGKNIEIQEGGSIEFKPNAQRGKALIVMNAEDTLKSEKGAQVVVSGIGQQDSVTSNDPDTKIHLHGGKKMDLQQGSHFDPLDGSTMITGGDATIAASMKGVVLARTKNLLIEENSATDLRKLRAIAEEKIIQKGVLNADDFFLYAKYVENYGKINGKKGIIKADRWYWNRGSVVSYDSLDITAPASINWTSHTKSKKLTTNSLLDINLLSVDETQILDNKSLLSLDLSLHLPMFTDDMISDASIKDASTRAFLLVAPPQVKLLYKLATFLARMPGMLSEGKAIVKDIEKLYKDPNTGASDWTHLITRTVSLCLAAKQGCNIAQELYAELPFDPAKTDQKQPGEADRSDSPVQKNNENKTKNSANKNPDQSNDKTPFISHTSQGLLISLKTFENVKEAAAAAVSIGGALINQHHNRQSLVDLNFGLAVGFNGSSLNLRDACGGRFYANYRLDTFHGQNFGIMAGGNVSISANNYQNGISSNLSGQQIESSACIAALNLGINSNSFKGSAGSTITTINGASLETKDLDNRGIIHGSLNFKFTGEPDQLKSIGKVNAQGGSFSYQGPIGEDDRAGVLSADELARGSGSWGSISGARAISFDAGAQDIHIKDQHDMPHALHAKTSGNITVSKPLKSELSISLHAQQDLTHNSLTAKEHIQRIAQKGSIKAGSDVARVCEGSNYEDKVNQCSVISGKSNTAYAGKDIIQKAVETKSGKEGIVLVAKGDIVDDYLNPEAHIQIQKGTESTKDTSICPHVSTYDSNGKLIIHAGGKYKAHAPVYNARGCEKSIGGLQGSEIKDVKQVHIRESTKKSNGWWSSEETREKINSVRSLGAQFIGHATPYVIYSGAHEAVLVSPHSDAPLIFMGESASVLLGENKTVGVKENTYANVLYEAQEFKPTEELTYVDARVPRIENYTRSFLIQSVKGKTCAFLDKINNINEGQVTVEFLDEYRHADTSSSRRLTNNARIVLGLSIGLLTQGVGTSVAAGLNSIGVATGISTVLSHMTTGSINQLLNKAAHLLVETNGDIHKAVGQMASSKTLQEVTFAAVSAGAMSGANQAMNILGMPYAQEGRNLLERVAYAAPSEFIQMGVKTGLSTLAGQPIKQVLSEQLKDFAAKTLHNALVGEIADLYAADHIDSFTHKVLHGVAAGSVYGAIHGSMSTAFAAGLGAFSAEIAAELRAPSKNLMNIILKADIDGHSLTREEFMRSYAQAMQDYMAHTYSAEQIGQLTAAITALATGQDADIAHQSAITALDNNFLVLAMYGLTAASAAYSGYQVYKSYQEGGVEEALKQLGVEIAYNAAGHVAGKGIARFGGKIYPYVEDAARAALDEAPALKLILGDLAEKLIVGAQKLNGSSVGKCVAKIEATLLEQEAKILDKIRLNARVSAAGEGTINNQDAQTLAEVTVVGATQSSQNKNFHVKHKLSFDNENLLKSFDPQNYSSEIMDPEKLVKAKDLFAYTEGAMGKDGPLKRLLSIDSKRVVTNRGVLGTARGAAFELERALILERNGNKIVEFGAKVPLINEQTNKVVSVLDVDIVTQNLFIECKNYDWGKIERDRLPKIIEKIQSRLPELHKAALQAGKNLEIHSKYEIPDNLKNWLIKKNIKFVEG